MNVLHKQLGKDYFGQTKQVQNKNKKGADLSSYAAKFVRVFLERWAEFIRPSVDAHYALYSIVQDCHANWLEGAWSEDVELDTKLGVIEVQKFLGILTKKDS